MLAYYNITQQGESHIEKDITCQDYSLTERVANDELGLECVIGALSDGVGACSFSNVSSEIACKAVVRKLKEYICTLKEEPEDIEAEKKMEEAFLMALIDIFQYVVNKNDRIEDYECTLTAFLYNGDKLTYGHIGDDGIVCLFNDGSYKMVTERNTGNEINMVIPLRARKIWSFGTVSGVSAAVACTDGVLNCFVDQKRMNNRVFYPFIESVFSTTLDTEEKVQDLKSEWENYFSRDDFRKKVKDDLTMLVVQSPDKMPSSQSIEFDFEKWDQETKEQKKKDNEILYKDYYEYKRMKQKMDTSTGNTSTNDDENLQDAVDKTTEALADFINSTAKLTGCTGKLIEKAVEKIMERIDEIPDDAPKTANPTLHGDKSYDEITVEI